MMDKGIKPLSSGRKSSYCTQPDELMTSEIRVTSCYLF